MNAEKLLRTLATGIAGGALVGLLSMPFAYNAGKVTGRNEAMPFAYNTYNAGKVTGRNEAIAQISRIGSDFNKLAETYSDNPNYARALLDTSIDALSLSLLLIDLSASEKEIEGLTAYKLLINGATNRGEIYGLIPFSNERFEMSSRHSEEQLKLLQLELERNAGVSRHLEEQFKLLQLELERNAGEQR